MSAVSMDITRLTDEELSQRLRDLGADIGPILDTTRRVYQKKLERLMAGKVYEPPVITDQDEYSDEDVADGTTEEPVVAAEPETRSDVRELRKRPMTAKTRTTTVISSVETSEVVDSVEKVNGTSETTKEDQKETRPGMSKWVQFGILLVVGAILFLIFQNMEPAGKNPFSRLTS